MAITADSLVRSPSELLSDLTPDVGTGFTLETALSSATGSATASGAVGDGVGINRWAIYVSQDTYDADQSATADLVITNASSSDQAGVVVRGNAATGDFYALWIRPNQANKLQLYRCDATAFVLLAQYPIAGFATGTYNIELTAETVGGDVELKSYLNGALAGTFTDSAANKKLSGGAGVALRDASIFLQDFSSDNLASVSVLTPTNKAWSSFSGRSVTLVGSYTGAPTSLERQVDGGAWEVAVASPSGGTFTDSFSLSLGEHTVKYRHSNDTGVESATVTQVVSPIFMGAAAQSNESGRLTSNQTLVAGATGTLAYLLGNDDTWKVLADPWDSDAGQVDAVSADSAAAGSWVVLLANNWLADKDTPVTFIPNAKGGTTIAEWQKDSADRVGGLNLYESMARRHALTDGVAGAIAELGESDAQAGTLAADYKADLIQFANDVQADFGVKTILVPLHTITAAGYDGNGTTTGQDAIRAAQVEAAAENSNIVLMPSLADIDISDGDGLHFKSTADGQEVADRVYSELSSFPGAGAVSPDGFGSEVGGPIGVSIGEILAAAGEFTSEFTGEFS